MVNSLGVCSWSLKPDSCGDLIHHLGLCELSRVQIALDPITSGSWDIQSLMNQITEAKVVIRSGMMETIGEDYSTLESIKATGGLRPDQHWDENLRRAQRDAEVAHDLKLNLVTFHAGFIPEEDSSERRTLIERIKAIADVFGEFGIRVGLETGQERAESLLELLSSPNLSHVGVNFDPANMILYGMGDPARSLELLKDHIVQVHMKDACVSMVAGTWGKEMPAGQGEVDWNHFFNQIRTLPNAIDVVIEREAGDQRVKDIIQAQKIATEHGCGL